MTEVKTYTPKEAFDSMKSEKKRKFDPTVELHINLRLDPKKADQQIRYTTMLPHGTGKSKTVAVMASSKVDSADLEITESDLPKIESGEIRAGRDFDVLVAEPAQMGKLAKVARVLGPAGVMPNPKNGTVTDDVEAAIEQIKKGKVEIKMEQLRPIIHTILGKVSFETNKLEENLNEVMNSLKSNKPQKAKPDYIESVFVSSSMGRSYKLDL